MANKKSRFPSYGLVRGPSHEHGGVAGVVAGEQPVELEGGEWIIPKEVVPDYLPVLKQITNEGRAIQKMENGNTAMDALIASASMQTGLAQPKSPMYQEGGKVNKYFEKNTLPYDEDVFSDKMAQAGASQNPAGLPGAALYGLGAGLATIPMSDKQRSGGAALLLPALAALYGASKFRSDKAPLKRVMKGKRPLFRELDFKTIDGDVFMSSKKGWRQLSQNAIDSIKENNPELADYYNFEQGGPVYQEGGKVSFLEKLPLIGPQLKGYREYQEADRYIDKRHRGQPLFSEDTQRSGIQVAGETRREVESENDKAIKHLFNTAMVNYDPEETSRGIARFSKSDSGESALKKLLIGTPSGYRVSEDDRLSYAVDPENIARVTPGKKLLGMFPVGYSGSVEPNVDTESQLDFSNLEALKSLAGYEQGGPIKQYGHGGQALPRKQQEIRNPAVYGPPLELMGPMPTDTSAVDTTGDALQHWLNQLRMRDVNQSINPFTGDTIDTYLDSLRLQQRMKKSKIPQSAGRKKARQGGPVMYQEGGMVQGGQALERRPPESMGDASFDNSLMGSIGMDRRVKPVDRYTIKGGEMTSAEMEIPKLSTAYLASFGMETPLSKRQQALLFRKGIAPQTLNPQVKGLINRALVQRLANEED